MLLNPNPALEELIAATFFFFGGSVETKSEKKFRREISPEKSAHA